MSPARIYILAGVNGAGKSSVGGAAFRAHGADYFNPDEAAQRIRARLPHLTGQEANGLAWRQGKRLLERAIAERLDFALETTLGGATFSRMLMAAAASGIDVHVWYVGLANVGQHIARVRARVARGGHDIPEADIRRRFNHSRLNAITLLPVLKAFRLFDNSAEADPGRQAAPVPQLLLDMADGRIVGPRNLKATPEWARPIVAAAIKLDGRSQP